MLPSPRCMSKVAVPSNTRPIKLKPLHVELGGDVLQIVGRTYVTLAIKEPVNWIHWRPNVNGKRLEPLGS